MLTFSSLAMTCASPSFRISAKCSHVTHSPSLSAHVQIPFMCCLGTLVLDRLASYSTHGISLTTRIHWGRCGDERRGRRRRNEAGSRAKVKGAGHRARELHSHYISGRGMLYEQVTNKVPVIRLCSPGHVQIASVRF